MDDIEGKIVIYTAGKRDLKRLVKKLHKKSYNSLSEYSKLMLLICEDTLKALKGKPHNTELSVQY